MSNIERSFRSLKSLHELEPVFHHADRRIKAHVFICILAHLLERHMEKKFSKENFTMTAAKALEHLSRMKITRAHIKDKKFLIRTETQKEMNNIFKALHCQPPKRIDYEFFSSIQIIFHLHLKPFYFLEIKNPII